jgi:hypothetical protein
LHVAQWHPGIKRCGGERVPQRVRADCLADPGLARDAADDPTGAVPVQPPPVQQSAADVGGRGMLQELFFDGVFVEPGDGTQPPGDGSAGKPVGFQVPGEDFNISAADCEQVQGMGAAPGSELAQVQRARLAGQPAVPGQESNSLRCRSRARRSSNSGHPPGCGVGT